MGMYDREAPSLGLRSCYACFKAKRRCSKQKPTCQRCEDRKLGCEYPAGKPTCFVPLSDGTEPHEEAGDHNEETALVREAPPTYESGMLLCQYSQTAAARTQSGSWFLSPCTWLVHRPAFKVPDEFSVGELKSFLRQVLSWIETWVRTGSNTFIHARLYVETIPACVRIAYTTASSYLARNEINTELTLRILNEQADDLIMTCEASRKQQELPEQLARVQALFIYVFIGLLDGDIRSRHLAELRLPKLMMWLDELFERAGSSLSTLPLDWELDALFAVPGKPLHGRSELWRTWILAESIRRTWCIGKGAQAAYQGIKEGAVGCNGDVMYTSGMGVWDARSADAWEKLCIESDVRFMQRFHAERLLQETCPHQVDEFGKVMLSITYGPSRVANWVREGPE